MRVSERREIHMTTSREKKLLEQGWTRQFVASEPRLSEASEFYRSIGYDVLLEPLPPEEEGGECRTCLEADPSQYRTIYTRKAATEGPTEQDELFD